MDNLFDDLEKLMDECDEVTKSFNESQDLDETVVPQTNIGPEHGDLNEPCGNIYDNNCKNSVVLNSEVHNGSEDVCNDSKMNKENKSGTSTGAVRHSWKPFSQVPRATVEPFLSEQESSREKGECTVTFVEVEHSPVLVKKLDRKKLFAKKENSYSSFIDSSREEGECSTTSFETEDTGTTIKEVSPKTIITIKEASSKMIQASSNGDKENNSLLHKTNKGQNRKRKRPIFEENEITPKRLHHFDEVLSPITGYASSFEINNKLETPLIEGKVSFQGKDICSSTPITTKEKYGFPYTRNNGTPVAKSRDVCKQDVHSKKITAGAISDSDSEFEGVSCTREDGEKTVDELIAEITQICQGGDILAEEENTVIEGTGKTFSNIEIDDIISELKTRSSCEIDLTITDNDREVQSEGVEELDSTPMTVSSCSSNVNNSLSVHSFNESRGGRFKAEVTVSRVEVEEENVTITKVVDMDLSEVTEDKLLYSRDILNLNDYEDEGFIDEKDLAHITKDINETYQGEKNNVTIVEVVVTFKDHTTAKESDDAGQAGTNQIDSLFVVQGLKKQKEERTDTKLTRTEENNINENVVKGLDFAAFDTSIYRKRENTAIERDICRRWGTHGSTDPDLNLTVSTTKRGKLAMAGEIPSAGFLEGDRVVCTNLYEEEIISKFSNNGKTDGQSDLCFMKLENLLAKLHYQKNVLENMKKQSISNLRNKLECETNGMERRHCDEMNALKYRYLSLHFITLEFFHEINLERLLKDVPKI